jgi:hypothetical protein
VLLVVSFVVITHNVVKSVTHRDSSSVFFVEDFVEFFLNGVGLIFKFRIVEFKSVVVLAAEFRKLLIKLYIWSILELNSWDVRVEGGCVFVRSTIRINK